MDGPTYKSCGRVASSVLEYNSRPPPLSMLKYFSDAKSVYSLVTANRSTQTPDCTACAACGMPRSPLSTQRGKKAKQLIIK